MAAELRGALLDARAAAELAPMDGQAPAAVLVALFERHRRLYAVLTRRRADLRRHAGEIAFPGGRRDPADASLIDTALREAEEEIGLPAREVALVGALPRTSTFVTNYAIQPFVGLISPRAAWTVSPGEVDAVLELALDDIASGRTRQAITRHGFTFETDGFLVGGNLVWGATARIIDELLARVAPLTDRSRPAPPRGCPTPSTSRRSS
ncbi:MAG: CoA pyrophosphatase [Solirubrobacterales bacterium]|nr:CoA pyrophosphatase [Solirubrobacterales bacterium]